MQVLHHAVVDCMVLIYWVVEVERKPIVESHVVAQLRFVAAVHVPVESADEELVIG